MALISGRGTVVPASIVTIAGVENVGSNDFDLPWGRGHLYAYVNSQRGCVVRLYRYPGFDTANTAALLDSSVPVLPLIETAIPWAVFVSPGTMRVVPTSRSCAGSASLILANTMTITVPTGHGFIAGDHVSTSGGVQNLSDATLTAVTATTISAPKTAADAPVNGAVSVTDVTPSSTRVEFDTAF